MNKKTKIINGINEILFYKWDPIGISKMDDIGPYDEYLSYANIIFEMIDNDISKTKIELYLADISSSSIGLPTTKEHNSIVARKLMTYINNV